MNDGNSLIDFTKYLGILIIGNRGKGKTALLERINEEYYEGNTSLICDWWSPRNFENLFYVIPNDKRRKPIPIVLIHPEYVDVNIPSAYKDLITPMCDKVGLREILKLCVDERRVCCFDNTSYDFDHSYEVLGHMLKELPDINKKYLHADIVLSLREVSSLLFSHLKIAKFSEQTRKMLLQTIKEARHNNITLVLDTQRFMDVYAGVRDNIDVTLIKNSNPRAFPEALHWFWNRIDIKHKGQLSISHKLKLYNSFPQIHRMGVNQYYELWNNQSKPDRVKTATLPKRFMHKSEKDNFVKIIGGNVYTYHKHEDLSDREKLWKDRSILFMKALKDKGTIHKDIASIGSLHIDQVGKYLRELNTTSDNLR